MKTRWSLLEPIGVRFIFFALYNLAWLIDSSEMININVWNQYSKDFTLQSMIQYRWAKASHIIVYTEWLARKQMSFQKLATTESTTKCTAINSWKHWMITSSPNCGCYSFKIVYDRKLKAPYFAIFFSLPPGVRTTHSCPTKFGFAPENSILGVKHSLTKETSYSKLEPEIPG